MVELSIRIPFLFSFSEILIRHLNFTSKRNKIPYILGVFCKMFMGMSAKIEFSG